MSRELTDAEVKALTELTIKKEKKISKELEAFYDLIDVYFDNEVVKEKYGITEQTFIEKKKIIETALKEHELMKQAKTIVVIDKKISDEDLERLKNTPFVSIKLEEAEKALKDNEWLNKELVKFETAFTEENEEKLKLKEILKIIKVKEIDIWLLKVCDYDNYCRIRTKCLETNVGSMVDCDKPAIPLPTKEEYDLLKEVLK